MTNVPVDSTTISASPTSFPINPHSLPHHWADSDVRFKHLDYRGRRAIERAFPLEYLYHIGRRTGRVHPVIKAWYDVCCERRIPFCLVQPRTSWATVVLDLTTCGKRLNEQDTTLLRYETDRAADTRRTLTYMLHSIGMNAKETVSYSRGHSWFSHPRVYADGRDQALAQIMLKFVRQFAVQDPDWIGAIGAKESVVVRCG